MSKRKRTILFGIFVSLFLVSIIPIVLYTKGYRVDFYELRLVETGGIDLNINTMNAKVYLEDELKRETSFIFRSAVFRNILPGDYKTAIKKDGYKTWEKKISVSAGQVSKFIDIRLFPEILSQTLLMEKAQKVFFSPNTKLAFVQSESNIFSSSGIQKGIQLFLSDNTQRTLTPILTLQTGESVKEILWSSNSDIFFIFIQSQKDNFLYSGSAGRAQELVNWSTFLKNTYTAAYNSDNVRIPTVSANSLYVMQKDIDGTFSLNKLDIDQRFIKTEIFKDISAFEIVNGNIFYIDKEGFLFTANIESTEHKQLSATAIAGADKNTKIIIRDDKEIVAVINNGDLFLWEKDAPLAKIAEKVTDLRFSPDKEKLLYWNNYELDVYWTKKVFGPPSRVPGDREIIKDYSAIKNAGWANNSSSYIVFESANKIVFAELDSRDRRNVFEYEEVNISGNLFAIDRNELSIYTVINGNLVSLKYD